MLVSLGCETLVLVAHALLHVSKLVATITALSQKCFDYFFSGARQIRCALHLGSDKLPAALKILSRLQGQLPWSLLLAFRQRFRRGLSRCTFRRGGFAVGLFGLFLLLFELSLTFFELVIGFGH